MTIRHSTEADIPSMQEVFAQAKQKMRADGNLQQWTGSYPTDDLLKEDIRRGFSYVVTEDSGRIVATFVLAVCEDPTYKVIYDGEWLEDTTPYGTIHRIASRNDVRGIARLVFGWCFEKIGNIRIDTHRDNHLMQHIVTKAGFTYCGIILIADGSERLAYQKIINR